MDFVENLRDFKKRYTDIAFTNYYIFGYMYRDYVYFYITGTLPDIGLKLSEASRNQGLSMRYRPSVYEKEKMIELGVSNIFCTSSYFLTKVYESRYNKGEIFEKLVTERLGHKWVKDTIPFTKAGDIIYKNISYQIKFENATFTTEKTLCKQELIKKNEEKALQDN